MITVSNTVYSHYETRGGSECCASCACGGYFIRLIEFRFVRMIPIKLLLGYISIYLLCLLSSNLTAANDIQSDYNFTTPIDVLWPDWMNITQMYERIVC